MLCPLLFVVAEGVMSKFADDIKVGDIKNEDGYQSYNVGLGM